MTVLSGRNALVTGGGHGLGRSIAVALDAAGARVIVCGRDRGQLEETVGLLRSGRSAICDVADPASVDALAAELAGEEISILVNNAGIAGPTAPLTQVEPAQWDEVMAVNVRGTYLMCRAFLPSMVARGAGDIVNIASVSGKRPLIDRTPYCASKMAVIGLTTTLALEVGPSGVRVNSLSPGYVRGPRMTGNLERNAARTGRSVEAVEREFVERTALHRMLEEDEVGAAVVAMLQLPGMTGADVDLSAGMVAR
ncbi:MAG TPA: SDR family oxidoreductase [Mycobacteriales bacterium]|nr:SDR family oxidoreductase [Mycobacteriales bacterium]